MHEQQVMACIEHGKPALCEKPLTMASESSRRLVGAEHKAGRPAIHIGFMRRFAPRARPDEAATLLRLDCRALPQTEGRSGDELVGPSAWDCYAATAVCTASMASVASGAPSLGMVSRSEVCGRQVSAR